MKRKREAQGDTLDDHDPPLKRAKLEKKDTEEVIDNIEEEDGSPVVTRVCSSLGVDVSNLLSSDLKRQVSRALSSRSSISEESATSSKIIRTQSSIPTSTSKLMMEEEEEGVHINQLPVEICIMIFEYLEDWDRLKLAQTSARYWYIFNDFVGYGRSIVYRGQLKMDDLADTFDVKLSSGELVLKADETIETTKYELVKPKKELRHPGGQYVIKEMLVIFHPTLEREESVKAPMFAQYVSEENKNRVILGTHIYTHFSHSDTFQLFSKVIKWSSSRFRFVFSGLSKEANCQVDVDLRVNNDKSVLSKVAQYIADKDKEIMVWPRSNNTSCPPSNQPARLKLPLKDYQRRCLNWMLSVEEGVAKGVKYSFESCFSFPQCHKTLGIFGEKGNCINPIRKMRLEVVPTNEIEVSKYTNTFDARGGILADEMGLGKTITVLALIAANERKPDAKPINRLETEFETTATLIICPNQIVAQWGKEITTHTDFNVITITTIRDLKKYTVGDLLDADVVVVSHQFLVNKNYHAKLELASELDGSCNNLSHIGWARIVCDEAHELGTIRYQRSTGVLQHIGREFLSDYWWYVSGTPFSCGIEKSIQFIGAHAHAPFQTVRRDLFDYAHFQAVRNTLFWRNTKETVAEQTNIPDFIEDIQFVKLTSSEKLLYKVAEATRDYDSMTTICTQPVQSYWVQIMSNKYSVKDWPSQLEVLVRKQIIELTKQVQDFKKKLAKANAKYARPEMKRFETAEHARNRIQRKITKLEGCIRVSEQKLADLVVSLAITQNHHTPDTEWHQCASFVNSPAMRAVNYHGSKIAYVLNHIQSIVDHDPKAKIIVFSQTNTFLDLISVCMTDFTNIKASSCVRCVGNVNVRKKAIDRFNDTSDKSSVNLILLSLADTASGTHLAIASHIVLVDAVSGDKNQAQACDAQAIARAHRFGQNATVRVVRFIVPHTIEQINYESVYGPIRNVPSLQEWDGSS